MQHPILSQRCGVIGLGMIGAGLAECLVRKGYAVAGYDVRPQAMSAIDGLHTCATPADVARQADVLIVSVVNAEQARSVLFGPQGVAEGAHGALVVALMCTIRVPLVIELAREAEAKGFKLIDVAITTGGVSTASATAGLMAGGDSSTIESVCSVMTDCSSIFAHMGPLGAGMAAKVARNIMHYGAVLAAYEGGLLAEAAGVDIAQLIDVIRTSDPDNVMSTVLLKNRGVKPLQDLPEDTMSKFRAWAELMHKDLDAGIGLAEELGVDVPGARLSQTRGDLVYGLPPGTTQPHVREASQVEDPKVRGLKMMDAVYGKGQVPFPSPDMPLPPYLEATVDTVFGQLWARPGLSVRDRRLLVMGATAQMMRPDLIETQAMGALLNGELNEEQLQEAVLQLAYYCGWGKGASVFQGVNAAITKAGKSQTSNHS